MEHLQWSELVHGGEDDGQDISPVLKLHLHILHTLHILQILHFLHILQNISSIPEPHLQLVLKLLRRWLRTRRERWRHRDSRWKISHKDGNLQDSQTPLIVLCTLATSTLSQGSLGLASVILQTT